MSPGGYAESLMMTSLPRTCGDEPMYYEYAVQVNESAPHLRG